MTTTATIAQHTGLEISSLSGRAHTNAKFIDYSRGAVEVGIRRQMVWLDAGVVEDYAEMDPTLGRNVGGVVLSVLARHLSTEPDGGNGNIVTVGLFRREDGKLVDVDLQITRGRHQGTSRLLLTKVDAREVIDEVD